MIDVLRCLGESTLSLQVDAGRCDSLAFRIENNDLITVVAFAVKRQFVSVMDMRAGRHLSYLHPHATAYHEPPLLTATLDEAKPQIVELGLSRIDQILGKSSNIWTNWSL